MVSHAGKIRFSQAVGGRLLDDRVVRGYCGRVVYNLHYIKSFICSDCRYVLKPTGIDVNDGFVQPISEAYPARSRRRGIVTASSETTAISARARVFW